MLTDADARELSYFVGLQWEASDQPALSPLIDAALVWAGNETLAAVAVPVVETLWENELREDIERALAHGAEQDPYVRRALAAAREDLALGPRRSRFARVVVEQGAFDLAFAEQLPVHCLLCVEEGLWTTPSRQRRAKALRVARIASRAAAVPEAELRAAVTTAAFARGPGDAAAALASDDRRRAVRVWLRRIAELGSTSVPTLAAELLALADEAVPRVEADDVWHETVAGLIAQLGVPWN
jgi:hypothetical protein